MFGLGTGVRLFGFFWADCQCVAVAVSVGRGIGLGGGPEFLFGLVWFGLVWLVVSEKGKG